ncbi:MAG: hypothetical protein QNJ68_23690 [Microcoleaceae cyanobacterium MO_207.B10]|nr:hypothetical protein [Microcoleaceae cyanobacterium MO_207.B10]
MFTYHLPPTTYHLKQLISVLHQYGNCYTWELDVLTSQSNYQLKQETN